MLAFGSHQGDNGTFFNTCFVEFSVNKEDILGQIDDMVFIIFSISFGTSDGEVEFIAGIQVFQLVFESFKSQSQPRNELKWMFCGGFFCEIAFSVFDGI